MAQSKAYKMIKTLLFLVATVLLALPLLAVDVTMTPSTDQVVSGGGSISFSCSSSGAQGDVTYAWTFQNGSPASSISQNPGPVTFGKNAEGKESECSVTATDTKDGTVCGTDAKSIKVIVPSLKITSIDVGKDEIKFDILPNNLPQSEVKIIIKGPSNIEMVVTQLGGGMNKIEHFDWSKFPQTPGQEFSATSVEIQWKKGQAAARDSKNINFIGYGVFQITRYVTPDDDQWNGPTEKISFKKNGGPPYREVHSLWIERVRGQEGRGMSQGNTYQIKDTQPGSPVANYMTEEWQGAYVKYLSVDWSLAHHKDDNRFKKFDKILLATDKGHFFRIEDNGDWGGGYDHLDRYGGVVGPDDPNVDFPSSYVVKVKE